VDTIAENTAAAAEEPAPKKARKGRAKKSAGLDPAKLFPFPLDDFQTDAIQRIDEGHSVLVCAPTGSGKTVIAEYAIHKALAEGQRVFYTTPLKALSNQKFRDLGGTLGEQRVGLLTGDISINRDADVVVMTTEVFRNMLYGTTLGAVETSLRNVRFVVLDEVHYMNDEQRGTVWEESIIYCPPNVQLVALSATVANAPDMAAWMNHVHGDTTLITTDFRPVPLRFHYFEAGNLTSLLRKLRTSDYRSRIPKATQRHMRRGGEGTHPDEVVQELARQDMLPAICFVFSRKGCDSAMLACAHLQLLKEEEVDRVEAFLEQYAADYPSVADHSHLPYLFRGLAVHHAGQLPTWKVLVERLFQMGLVKIVFATETLAAGINMPARTTVLSSITKRGDQGHRMLTASEFLQMSGRAGRRGMDKVGHVVVIASPYQTIGEAQALATAPPDPLGSHFTPTYGMVLNLLQRHTLEEAEFLISRSFGQFLDDQRLAKKPARRRKREAELQVKNPALGSGNWARFLKLRDVLQHYGYLESDHPTACGVMAAALRAEHELLVAEVVRSGAVDSLKPAQLAAIATALVSEDLRPSAWVKAAPVGATLDALKEIVKIAREIRIVQNRYRVDVRTRVHSDVSGLTQMWAEGAEWDYLMNFTNLDEGDVVRSFRRTVDLLEQIRHAPMLDDHVRSLAREAVDAMDREPVREVM
jgi:superfamily II RNA helicase